MKTSLCCMIMLALLAAPAGAEVVEDHILPRYDALGQSSIDLAEVSQTHCMPKDPALEAAYHQAFDDWISISHIRFGPSEVGDRAFALAFWPDARGFTAKTLMRMIADKDPSVADPVKFAEASIAARGFYALEFLLFDEAFVISASDYSCALVQAITENIASNATAIDQEWRGGYGASLQNPVAGSAFQNQSEVMRTLFTALVTALEFDADTRLARPLGTFDAPKPLQAEARRSQRSERHLLLSLEALRDLAAELTPDADLAAKIDDRFAGLHGEVSALDDPVFSGVADPSERLKIEIIQQHIKALREVLSAALGPALGVAAGFNALDGD